MSETTRAAIQLIEAIASNINTHYKVWDEIKAVLEDGEALIYLGVTEEDQETVEGAHAHVCRMIEDGWVYMV